MDLITLAAAKNYTDNRVNDPSYNQDLSDVKNDVTSLKASKVDKEDSKGLSTNDFTDDDKAKLESLSNYDDTEVKDKIATLSSAKLDKQQGTDNAGKFLSVDDDGVVYTTALPDVTALDVEYDDEQEALSFVSGTAQRDSSVVDDTLSVAGEAADAKVTGDGIAELKGDLEYCQDSTGYTKYELEPHPISKLSNNMGINNNVINLLERMPIVKGARIKSIDLYVNTSGEITLFVASKDGNKITPLEIYTIPITESKGLVTIKFDVTIKHNGYIGFISNTAWLLTFTQDDSAIISKSWQVFNFETIEVGTPLTSTNTLLAMVNININFDNESVIKKIDAIEEKKIDFSSLKFACFGDSIESDAKSGVGTKINAILGTTLIKNFAHGSATCADWYSTNGDNITTQTISITENIADATNVLSNQILQMLQHTTPLGEQIHWKHPAGYQTYIDTSVAVGLGYTDDIPDIIHIAIGTNDGIDSRVMWDDDVETVMEQKYEKLTRTSIASAMRWAIETLKSAYPNVQIFVASPLFANYDLYPNAFSLSSEKAKTEIIKKICAYCSVTYIPANEESGVTYIWNKFADGLHPNSEGQLYLANYHAKHITNFYISTMN
jgi:lysophospholipase L1-like esterase